MRTGARVAIALSLVGLAGAIAFVAYQAGLDAGATSADGQVVRVVGDGWRAGAGFFPGFLFFPLFLLGAILLAKFVFRGPRRGPEHGWYGPPGPRHHDWEQRAADWHRRQHEQASSGDDPAGPGPDDSWPERP